MTVPEDALPEYDDFDAIDDTDAEDDYLDEDEEYESGGYRTGTDPTFGYLIALALAVGLMALPAEHRDLRYSILWMIPAGFGVLAWLVGNGPRVLEETPENLAWGIAFALIIATPLLAVGGSTLTATVHRLFLGLSPGAVLAYLVFVMPLAETLFFRGILQEDRAFWLVGLMSSLWSALLFFPQLDVATYPAIVTVIGVALVMMNLTYSYVRQRNGLAAAWVCQIVVNLVLMFVPYIS